MSSSSATRNVYVVELDLKVLQKKKFADRNPDYQNGKAAFYVGMTGLSPEERFENHKAGRRANKYVMAYGVKLRPDIYQQYNPMPYKQAVAIEVALAADLRREGHAVWQA